MSWSCLLYTSKKNEGIIVAADDITAYQFKMCIRDRGKQESGAGAGYYLYLCTRRYVSGFLQHPGSLLIYGTDETAGGLYPVSYTHLDVYKRQMPNSPIPAKLQPTAEKMVAAMVMG